MIWKAVIFLSCSFRDRSGTCCVVSGNCQASWLLSPHPADSKLSCSQATLNQQHQVGATGMEGALGSTGHRTRSRTASPGDKHAMTSKEGYQVTLNDLKAPAAVRCFTKGSLNRNIVRTH